MTTTQIRQLTGSNIRALQAYAPNLDRWTFGATYATFAGDVQQAYSAVIDHKVEAERKYGRVGHPVSSLHAVVRKLNDALTAIGAGEEPNPKYVRVIH